MRISNERGVWGEELATAYLKRRFYRILDRGFRCRYGEIDIIARRGGYLVFVEVKLRKSAAFGQPMEYVDHRKQSRILSTASMYLAQYPTKLQPRFDVIEIYAPEGKATKKPTINHIKGAFT